jgi:hypothetical protein
MTAARKLSPAISDDDPLWRKFLAAPVDTNPTPEQETLALQQAQLGGFVDGATVSAEIARRASDEGKGPRHDQ